MNVEDVLKALAGQPGDAEVRMVTERHDLSADIANGGDPAESSILEVRVEHPYATPIRHREVEDPGAPVVYFYEDEPLGYL